MTIAVELTPEQEARLTAVARRKGIAPSEVIKDLVDEHLSPPSAVIESDPTLALFAAWDREDQHMTSEEVAEENRTWEQFKANVNAERNRAGARRVFPQSKSLLNW